MSMDDDILGNLFKGLGTELTEKQKIGQKLKNIAKQFNKKQNERQTKNKRKS